MPERTSEQEETLRSAENADPPPEPQSQDFPDNGPLWPHFRRLVVFQVKLYVDALRDLVMSPLTIGAFLIDMFTGRRGPGSAFERILGLGRETERAINLFDQHDKSDSDYRGIDSLIDQMEEGLRQEYSNGSVSASARDSIEAAMEKVRTRIGSRFNNKASQDTESGAD